MFNCPVCSKETTSLVIPEGGKLAGRCCANQGPKRYNVNLGQTVDKWTHIDKTTGNEIKHRLTSGKTWEIEHRTISKDDPRVCINKSTGKETQY